MWGTHGSARRVLYPRCCLWTQVNGVAQGSVATGTLSALSFAVALAAGAGVAYYCVKRRRQEGQFGYFQVCAGWEAGSGVRTGGRAWSSCAASREAEEHAWEARAVRRVGEMPSGRGRQRARPAGGGRGPGRVPPRRAPLQADLRAEEEEEAAAAGPGPGQSRLPRPLVAIPNPLYGCHLPDPELLLHVSAAPPPRADPAPAPPRAGGVRALALPLPLSRRTRCWRTPAPAPAAARTEEPLPQPAEK